MNSQQVGVLRGPALRQIGRHIYLRLENLSLSGTDDEVIQQLWFVMRALDDMKWRDFQDEFVAVLQRMITVLEGRGKLEGDLQGMYEYATVRSSGSPAVRRPNN